jgi:WhiB family redox-sensing transcriptional regulator
MFAEQFNEELWERETDEAPDLWDAAACNDGTGRLTEMFFSDEIPDIAAAKAICRLCPLMAPCLEGALQRREPSGVWGGQLFVNGRILALKRRRGRPPKHPREGIMLTA